MRLWRVVLLLNLALGAGVLLGYLAWGREIVRLELALDAARQQSAAVRGEGTWTARGVVRAVLPDRNIIVLTHEDIPGLMPSMTMGFKVHDPRLYQDLDIGATIRFTLKGTGPDNTEIVAIARERQ
ncbi:MAG TPA: copper-binding protein [Methylomirabilota bacterium]|nr:copper-binding protein [Methylomirabilota bacterium]